MPASQVPNMYTALLGDRKTMGNFIAAPSPSKEKDLVNCVVLGRQDVPLPFVSNRYGALIHIFFCCCSVGNE